MQILNVILMHFDVLVRTHMLDVLLLLLLATTVTAPLFWKFQPQSNNAAGSVVAPKTMVPSLTTVLKHKYAQWMALDDLGGPGTTWNNSGQARTNSKRSILRATRRQKLSIGEGDLI